MIEEAHACAHLNLFVRVETRYGYLRTARRVFEFFQVSVETCFLHDEDKACFCMTFASNWGSSVAYRALIRIRCRARLDATVFNFPRLSIRLLIPDIS